VNSGEKFGERSKTVFARTAKQVRGRTELSEQQLVDTTWKKAGSNAWVVKGKRGKNFCPE